MKEAAETCCIKQAMQKAKKVNKAKVQEEAEKQRLVEEENKWK